MPRIGSLTQRPRQMTRFGANMCPMTNTGLTKLGPNGGMEYIELGPRRVPRGGIGHSLFSTPLLKKPTFTGTFSLSGVTRDSAGVALAGCVVDLFLNSEDTLVATTTSDESGNYRFIVNGNSQTYFVRAYKAGSPDVAGTSVNTLTAVYP
jgi:hypothetical protein